MGCSLIVSSNVFFSFAFSFVSKVIEIKRMALLNADERIRKNVAAAAAAVAIQCVKMHKENYL